MSNLILYCTRLEVIGSVFLEKARLALGISKHFFIVDSMNNILQNYFHSENVLNSASRCFSTAALSAFKTTTKCLNTP